MQDIRTFKSYNFVTGAVDGTLAYDFSNPGLYQDGETYGEPYEVPQKQKAKRQREQEWVREDARPETRAEAEAERRRVLLPVAVLGFLCAAVLLVMVLLAQIRLADISNTAASLESQITELETERDKLTAEYETVFNLEDVEEYAVNVLGMQEPSEDQIYYLSGVSAGDRAVVTESEDGDMFSLGLSDLTRSGQAFLDKLQGIF